MQPSSPPDSPRRSRPAKTQTHKHPTIPGGGPTALLGPVRISIPDDLTPRQLARVNALTVDLDYIEATDRRTQLAMACKHLRAFEDGSRFTYDAIGKLFDVKGQVVKAQWRKSEQEPRNPGRPPLIPPDVQEWMVELITSRVRDHRPITYAELLDALQYSHRIVLSGDALRHIVREMPQIKSVVGTPMEAERVAVDRAVINDWYLDLAEKIQGIPREFVFNVDEAGCSEMADRREVKVLVPLDYPNPSVEVPFDRHAKRSTLTACIAADGFRMKPFLVVDRVTAEVELAYFGYGEANACIASQENAYMTRGLFDLWASKVFFPTLEKRRRKFKYTGRVLLLMDGAGSHHTEAFVQQCADQQVEVLFLVPHSSDQTQPLDLVTFSILKQRFAASKFNQLSTAQSNRLVRILGAWFSASSPHYNVMAFMNVGLVPVERAGRYYLRVQPEHGRRLREPPVPAWEIPPAPLPAEAHRRVRLPRGPE